MSMPDPDAWIISHNLAHGELNAARQTWRMARRNIVTATRRMMKAQADVAIRELRLFAWRAIKQDFVWTSVRTVGLGQRGVGLMVARDKRRLRISVYRRYILPRRTR